MKRVKIVAAAMAVCMLACVGGCSKKDEDSQLDDGTVPEGYTLVWNDEFDGDTLNEADWNRESHAAGWVNNELQKYVPSEDYAFVEDGNLVIRPVKIVDEDGRVSYESGRVNTVSKHELTYGYIEARIKFPAGKGFLPAFWMMPHNQSIHGAWPGCGEIDIAEIVGDNTNTTYGTIHYGLPHCQNQGIYTLPEGDFSSEYHIFGLEWEPGVIRWLIDGEVFYETSDWYSRTQGGTERTYPAPFNKDFFVIFNVAVGGDWPGSPDETTIFDERACMYVDYVRFYQRDSYDENVQKPERQVDLRDPGEDGNYIINGDLAVEENLYDDSDWRFMTFNGGEGSAVVRDGELVIYTTNEGEVDYSIQLVQAGLPMEQGATYRLSFDARADAHRQMNVDISGPDYNYIRYFQDTMVDLTTDLQSYSYEFEMTEESDDNGRIEFNMGWFGSTDTIYISNVRLEKIS